MMERSNTLSEDVYQIIRSNIINGIWEMGKRLTEKELSEQIHVSRTPIRWALSRLYDEGLLYYNKNIGYRVRIVTVDDIIEIYKIRLALEVLSFREASMKMSDADFQVLEGILAESKKAVENNDPAGLVGSSSQFNLIIYDFAQMPRLKMIQQNLQEYLARFRKISFGGEENDRREIAVYEHEQIIRAMKSKDFGTLEVLIEDHLNRSKEYILSVAEEYGTDYFSDDDMD